MNPNLIIVFAFLIAISLTQSASSENFFIVQISPVIDGKAARPSNLTISRNLTSSLSHTLSVSSTNFLKNVTIGLQLFSWYNGDWISKKSRTLQITDRRRIYSSLQKNLLTFMKYADLNAITSKEPVVLNQTSIYISYDPQGSLMTSQLQQPNLFIPNDNYLPVKDINKSIQRINTTLQFRVIHKTDDFILNKRALSELAEIQSRCSEVFPIIATPLNKDVVEPNQIMEIMRKNLQTLVGQEKKVGEKLQLIARHGYKPLLTKDIYKLDTLQDYLPIHDYLAKFKLTFKDTLGPIWQWIFNQPFVLAEVQTLQTSFLHEPESLVHNNILKQLSQAAALEQNIDWTVFGIWILLDLASYCFYSFSLGISSSNGTFLNILLISQLVAVSLRIGLASIWYLGLIIFFSGLLLHLVVCFLVQRRVNKVQHARSKSDAMLTSIIKNCLILAVFVNISMHLFGGSTITSNRIWNEGFQVLNRLQASPILSILWSFSQFCTLLSQYYYVLVLIPQIVLNFRLKNVQKTTLLRILLVGGLCYGEYGLRSLDTQPIYLVFRFKEGILAVILLLQWLAFHKNKVQALPAQIQQQVKVQQGLKSSDSSESMQQQKNQ